MANWQPFPHDSAPFEFSAESLRDSWRHLHRGDREPFPDADWIADILHAHPHAAPAGFDGAVPVLAEELQTAWRHFHAGRFAEAVDSADRCGLLGANCANKSAGIYATYLEEDPAAKKAIFTAAIARADQARQALPDWANTHYFHAFNLGRMSQSMSIMDALRQGLGGQIMESLNRVLALEPEHADAHTALGMYHAEVINKVGKLIGAMTYGASADEAVEHFRRAMDLAPDSPITHIEYANGLYLLYGDRKLEQVTDLYVAASEMEARDAMECLDIAAACAELE